MSLSTRNACDWRIVTTKYQRPLLRVCSVHVQVLEEMEYMHILCKIRGLVVANAYVMGVSKFTILVILCIACKFFKLVIAGYLQGKIYNAKSRQSSCINVVRQ